MFESRTAASRTLAAVAVLTVADVAVAQTTKPAPVSVTVVGAQVPAGQTLPVSVAGGTGTVTVAPSGGALPVTVAPGASLPTRQTGTHWAVTYAVSNVDTLVLTPSKPGVIEVLGVTCDTPGAPTQLNVDNYTMQSTAPFSGASEWTPGFVLGIPGGRIAPTVIQLPFLASGDAVQISVSGGAATCYVGLTGHLDY